MLFRKLKVTKNYFFLLSLKNKFTNHWNYFIRKKSFIKIFSKLNLVIPVSLFKLFLDNLVIFFNKNWI